MRISAVLLCAGLSSRMSRFKPLLPIGGISAVTRAASSLLSAGAKDVRVVVGYRADEVSASLKNLPVIMVENPSYEEGMFSSLKKGLLTFDRDETDGIFILPADIPLVSPISLKKLCRAYKEGTYVCHPSYRGKIGHPPLISDALREPILHFKGRGGLRAFFSHIREDNPQAIRVVPLDDPAILMDMDTDEDYKNLLKYWNALEDEGWLTVGGKST